MYKYVYTSVVFLILFLMFVIPKACIYTYICIYIYVFTVYINTRINTAIEKSELRLILTAHAYVCMHACVCMYRNIHKLTVHIHVYVYTFTHTHGNFEGRTVSYPIEINVPSFTVYVCMCVCMYVCICMYVCHNRLKSMCHHLL